MKLRNPNFEPITKSKIRMLETGFPEARADNSKLARLEFVSGFDIRVSNLR